MKIKSIVNKTYNLANNKRRQRLQIKKIKNIKYQNILKNYQLTEEQQKDIDKLYMENYGKKIPYDWHRLYASYTNHFDANFFPELLFPKFHRLIVPKDYAKVLSDKDLLPYIIGEDSNYKTAKIYLSCVKGIYRDQNNSFITKEKALEILFNIGETFIKPTIETSSGKGCSLLNIHNGIDILTNTKIDEIINQIGENFNVQEVLKSCETIRNLHPESINTFRIITYIWKNKVYHSSVVIRIGRGSNVVDNAHSGGIFVHVSDDGFLGECAYTEFQERFLEHPDTGIKFKGYCIPEIKKVLDVVTKLHQRIPRIGMIGWDATVDSQGKVVIVELNLKCPGIWIHQMASGKGIFGQNTKEILQYIKNN